jgi:hypothetical protein
MAGGVNWWPILIIIVLPLILGIASLVVASRFRRKAARITSRALAAIFFAGILWALILMAPYCWALHLEAKWSAANPTTKAQLESLLSLYSEREIQTTQSMWGRDYKLQSGERMIQYRLLYNAPLDVVYTSTNTIVAIYTSYE